jgi:hypothetical protein
MSGSDVTVRMVSGLSGCPVRALTCKDTPDSQMCDCPGCPVTDGWNTPGCCSPVGVADPGRSQAPKAASSWIPYRVNLSCYRFLYLIKTPGCAPLRRARSRPAAAPALLSTPRSARRRPSRAHIWIGPKA